MTNVINVDVERLEETINLLSIPAVLIDRNHRILALNKAIEKFSNMSKEDLIGTDKQWSFFYRKKRRIMADYIIDEELEPEIFKEYKNNFRKSKLIEGAYEGVAEINVGDGRISWLRFTASPLKNSDGEIYGAIETLEDVTEQKKLETELGKQIKFLSDILNAIPIPIFLKDTTGRYTRCNKAFETCIGITKENISGKSVYEISPKDLAEKYEEKDNELLNSSGVQTYESQIEYLDGSRHNVIFNKATFKNPDGSPGGLIGAILDITEIRKAEEAHKKSKERIRILENKGISLNEKDKQVLYSMILNPELNDIDLSEKLSMKRSTFTGIRNKLSKHRTYNNLMIPTLPAFGFELLTIRYGPLPALEKNELEEMFQEFSKTPEYVMAMATDNEFYCLAISEDYSTYRSISDAFDAKYYKNCDVTSKTIHFPFKSSRVKNFFGYAPTMKRCLGFTREETRPNDSWNVCKERNLSENESAILYYFTQNPDSTDLQASELTGLNKITISQNKKRLMDEGLMKQVMIPNMKELGCNIFCIAHLIFNPEIEYNTREKNIFEALPSPIAHVEDLREMLLLLTFKDYMDYKISMNRLITLNRRENILKSEPETMIFYPEKAIWEKLFEFAPLLKKRSKIK